MKKILLTIQAACMVLILAFTVRADSAPACNTPLSMGGAAYCLDALPDIGNPYSLWENHYKHAMVEPLITFETKDSSRGLSVSETILVTQKRLEKFKRSMFSHRWSKCMKIGLSDAATIEYSHENKTFRWFVFQENDYLVGLMLDGTTGYPLAVRDLTEIKPQWDKERKVLFSMCLVRTGMQI